MARAIVAYPGCPRQTPRGKRTAIFATDKMYHREPQRVRRLVERTTEALAAGEIAPVVATVLPLAQVAEAHRLVERGGEVGKIVLDCR
jgi:NADPH:quinone reductase-like Zn-dependent oxidoreductase